MLIAWLSVRCMQPGLCVFALSVKLTEVVRHVCVCWHVHCRLYAADGSLMPTGAEGVPIPPEINIHSSVGHVLVLYKFSCNTSNVRAA